MIKLKDKRGGLDERQKKKKGKKKKLDLLSWQTQKAPC